MPMFRGFPSFSACSLNCVNWVFRGFFCFPLASVLLQNMYLYVEGLKTSINKLRSLINVCAVLKGKAKYFIITIDVFYLTTVDYFALS